MLIVHGLIRVKRLLEEEGARGDVVYELELGLCDLFLQFESIVDEKPQVSEASRSIFAKQSAIILGELLQGHGKIQFRRYGYVGAPPDRLGACY